MLEGARRAESVALPCSCLAGACGSCKATLLERVLLRASAERARRGRARERWVLLCRAGTGDRPRHRGARSGQRGRHAAQAADAAVDKAFLNHDVVRLMLLSARGERYAACPASTSTSPAQRRAPARVLDRECAAGDHLELHVRHVAGGGFTSWVFDEGHVGAIVHAEGRSGVRAARGQPNWPLLMVAGGTELRADQGDHRAFPPPRLAPRRRDALLGRPHAADLYLRTVPEGWAADDPGFRFIPVIADPSRAGNLRAGFVHEAVLEDQPDLAAFDVYTS
ncbi:MAG: 2Fe-2S iron-sulfur cluster-binding protein [Lysobacterales bacterium]